MTYVYLYEYVPTHFILLAERHLFVERKLKNIINTLILLIILHFNERKLETLTYLWGMHVRLEMGFGHEFGKNSQFNKNMC